MPKNMLGIDSAALLAFWQGPLADLVVKAMGEEGEKVQQELTRFLREQPCWVRIQSQGLLKRISNVPILAPTNANFVVKDTFPISSSHSVRLGSISYSGKAFNEWFMGKVEWPMCEGLYTCYELRESCSDIQVLRQPVLESSDLNFLLHSLAYLMEKQKDDQSGPLLIDGNANFFFVQDSNRVLRRISLARISKSWLIVADPIGKSETLNSGCRVFL